jgi:hypothetical protein
MDLCLANSILVALAGACNTKNIHDEYKVRSATEVYIEALTQLCGRRLFRSTREPLDQPTSSDF